ncbi:MAG: hypothetical protein L3J81_04810, partial [Thermoplasmata archaeon]|nr:hypothetical protein [Thermoplasmata archaeon]
PTSDFSSGTLDFIPSVCGFENLDTFFGGGTAPLPAPVVSGGSFPCPTYTISFTQLSSTAFSGTTPFGQTPNSTQCGTGAGQSGSATLTPSGLQIALPVSGMLHLGAGTGGENLCPSANVALNAGTLTVTLAWQSATQQFSATAAASLNPAVVGGSCMDGLCDSMIAGALTNLNSEFGADTATALNGALSNTAAGVSASVANALYAVLAGVWNVGHQGDQGGDNGVPWTVVPGTVAYDTTNSQFTFEVSRNGAPAPSCSFTAQCGENVSVGCTMDSSINPETGAGAPDPVNIYTVVNGAPGALVATINDAISPSSTFGETVLVAPAGATSVTYVGCTTFPGGQTCDPVPPALALDTSSCSSTGPQCLVAPAGCAGRVGVFSNNCGGFISCRSTAPAPPMKCPPPSYTCGNVCC